MFDTWEQKTLLNEEYKMKSRYSHGGHMYTKAWSIDRKGEWGGGTKKIFHEAPPPQLSRIHVVRKEIASLPQRALKSTSARRSEPELRWIP